MTPISYKQHDQEVWAKNEKYRLSKVITKILRRLDTPYCHDIATIINNSDGKAYSASDISPAVYNNYDSILSDLFACDILRKSNGFFETLDPDKAGIMKFRHSERQCLKTNYRLYHNQPERDVEECIFSIRRILVKVLGDFSSFSTVDSLKWGPGVTKSISGDFAQCEKLGEYPFHISSCAWKLYSNYLSQFSPYTSYLSGIEADGEFCLLSSSFVFDDVAKIATVPKTFKVSRPITVEPTCNVSMTLAYGDLLRDRLARFGVNLRCQKRNQFLASKALELDLATVDLSSASDCIAIMLIQFLFPLRWAELILSLRTPYYCIDRTETRAFEKFAGMGNGFTFPLESLIFYAITRGVCETLGHDTENISIYGDDIICPSSIVPLLERVMSFLGFQFNESKTHYLASDLYRESCGAQYFNGLDVTPIYIKDVGLSYDQCKRNHNRLFRWLCRNGHHDLLPILGTLRYDSTECIVLGEVFVDIPEDDRWFFLHRGKDSLDLRQCRKRYRRISGELFLWWRLNQMDKILDWQDQITLSLQQKCDLVSKDDLEMTYVVPKKSGHFVLVRI